EPSTFARGSRADRATSCSGLGTASVRNTSALSRLPTATVAPTASANVTMTINEKVGARRKLRRECRTSRRSASHMREILTNDGERDVCRVLGGGVDALRRADEVLRGGFVDARHELLRIPIDDRKPRRLDLHHDSMALQEHVIVASQRDREICRLVGDERLGM